MSIYVRLGMHLLYYGSEQEKALESRRAQEMLKEQSVKMGKQYDAPESKSHIQPFIESFNLQDTLKEFVSLYHPTTRLSRCFWSHTYQWHSIPVSTIGGVITDELWIFFPKLNIVSGRPKDSIDATFW